MKVAGSNRNPKFRAGCSQPVSHLSSRLYLQASLRPSHQPHKNIDPITILHRDRPIAPADSLLNVQNGANGEIAFPLSSSLVPEPINALKVITNSLHFQHLAVVPTHHAASSYGAYFTARSLLCQCQTEVCQARSWPSSQQALMGRESSLGTKRWFVF